MTFQRGNRKASKLTGEQVLEIRERYAMVGVTQRQLAHDYGVSVNTIHSIVDGLTWRDLAGGAQPVNRPPPHALPPTMPDETTLGSRLEARLNNKGPTPSLYEDPVPYEQPDLTAASQERLQRALDRSKTSLDKLVSTGLAELDQDVLKITLIDKPKGD